MIAGKLGAVYRTDGDASIAFTDEATNKDSTLTRYSIANEIKRFWDESAAFTVKKNGVTINSGYSLEYAGGVVVFDAPLLGTDVVTVSGRHFTIEQCASVFEWKLDAQQDLKDVTTFSSQGWKEQFAITRAWSASSEGYWSDSSFAGLIGKRVAVSLFVDNTTNKRYEGYLYLKKNGIAVAVDDVVKETIDIEGTGKLYYHE